MLSGKINGEISIVGGAKFHPIFLHHLDNHNHCNLDIRQAIIQNTSEEVVRSNDANRMESKVYQVTRVPLIPLKIFGVG